MGMHPTDEQVQAAYDNAPKAIKDALASGPAVTFILSIEARYSLHVDTAGEVVQRIRDLLLGLVNPTQFLGELVQLGLSTEQARTLTQDLNREVFVPLREKMQSGSTESVEPPPRETPGTQAPAPSPLPPLAVEIPAPAVQPPREAEAPAPVAQPLPQGHQAPPGAWHPAAALHIYVPTQAHPHAPAPAQAPTASHIPPQPQAVYIAHPQAQPPSMQQPENSLPPVEQSPEPHKNPGSDPYREPIV